MREAVRHAHSHSAERPPQHKRPPPEAQELGQGGGAPLQAGATFPPFSKSPEVNYLDIQLTRVRAGGIGTEMIFLEPDGNLFVVKTLPMVI